MNIDVFLRPHQKYVLDKIAKEIDNYKYFFINMSTGGGKTLTSLLILKMIREQVLTKCLIATRTKNEFTPYFRDNKKFNLQLRCSGLVGKEEACAEDVLREILKSVEESNPCKSCPMRDRTAPINQIFDTIYENESLIPILQRKDICPYYSLRESFPFSDCFCVTYPYVFTHRYKVLLKSLDYLIEQDTPYKLMLIIDEAHNIDNVTELYGDIPRININGLIAYLEETRDITTLYMERNKLKAVSQIVRFYEFLDDPDFEVFTYEHGVILKLILPTRLIQYFTNEYNICVLMSGTLPPEDYIQRIWGIEGLYIDVTKEFKLYREQKQAYLISNVTTKYQYREKNYPKYAEIVRNFCMKDPNVKLIVYPSYEVMKRILSILDPLCLEKSIVEDVYTKIENVKREVEKGKVNIHCVAGGKLTEGIELVDEEGRSMIKSVVLIGVPYPDVNDYMNVKSRKVAELLGNEQDVFRYCYHIPAVLLSKQAIGRAIRSEHDVCRVYLCDYRFRYMIDELDVTVKSQVVLKLGQK